MALTAFFSSAMHVIPAGPRWMKYPLALLTFAGLTLASLPLSLNFWEPGEGILETGSLLLPE